MSIALVAQTTVSQGGGGALSWVSGSFTPGAGNLIVVLINETNGDALTGVAITGGASFTEIGTVATNSSTSLTAWYLASAPSGSVTITASFSSKKNGDFNASSYSGAAASPLDQRQTKAYTTATVQTGTIAPTNANALLVGHGASATGALTDYGTSGGTPTALTGVVSDLFAYEIGTSASPTTYGFQWNNSATAEGQIVSFNPPAVTSDNPSIRLPISAIRGNDPWWVAPPHIHQHNVVFFGPHGPGFCGRSQAISNVANTSVTVSFPAGIAAGDFVLVCITSSSGMCAAPAGWAQVGSTATNSVSEAMGLFWKIYATGDGASVTFGTTNLNFCEAIMRVYCGVMAIDANNSATSASAVTSLQIPALTATKFSNEIYVGFWSSDDNVVNGPNDLIDQTSSHYDGGVTANWATFDGDKVLPTAGTVPPAETANSATGLAASNWMGFAVTLILTEGTPALRIPPPLRAGMIPWIAPIVGAQATVTPFHGATEADARPSQLPLQAVQQSWWAPVVVARHTIAPFQAANPVPYDQQMAPFAAVQAGMAQWIAPIVHARTTTIDWHAANPPEYTTYQLPSAAIQQPWSAPVSALHVSPTDVNPPVVVATDTPNAALPIQAIQQGWQAPVQALQPTTVPFSPANPIPYDQQMAPFAAVQAGMRGWWAPVPALQATVTPFHGATENDARPSQLPLQAIQQPWWAPVPALQPTTTPFHGATENDARPAQLPLQAVQQQWWAPVPALHPTTVPFSPANPIPYDQQMAPLAAVQTGMQAWVAPVAQARTTTGDVTPPVATTGEPRLSQLPSAAIQQSWWAPVQALQPTTVPFSPANPPEYTTYQLPSAAIQQSWQAPVAELRSNTMPFRGATENDARPAQLPIAAIQQSWWAPVPALQPTTTVVSPANPVPYDQQMAPFAAVRSGMAGWWAPVPALQVRASWEGAAVEQRAAQLPIAAIQQGWWAPVQALQVTNTPFHGATEADARPSQLPLQAVQQAWWAPIPGLHPSMGVLFSPANPPEFTIYKLPSSAVQRGWWSPLSGAHVTSAEFNGPPPVIGVDAIVVWRHRAGMQ